MLHHPANMPLQERRVLALCLFVAHCSVHRRLFSIRSKVFAFRDGQNIAFAIIVCNTLPCLVFNAVLDRMGVIVIVSLVNHEQMLVKRAAVIFVTLKASLLPFS